MIKEQDISELWSSQPAQSSPNLRFWSMKNISTQDLYKIILTMTKASYYIFLSRFVNFSRSFCSNAYLSLFNQIYSTYTVQYIHCVGNLTPTHSKEFSGNQGNHQNFDPSLLPKKLWLIFMGLKQKKPLFSIPPILNIFVWKFIRLVLGLVGLIDAKGIVVAQPIWSILSDISSKMG